MSLSNEERRNGIYWSLDRINCIVGDLKSRKEDFVPDGIVHMLELVDQLWPKFLGKVTNSLHWVMGSSTSRTIKGEAATPWEVAVSYHCEMAYSKINDSDDWEEKEDLFNALEFENIPNLLRLEYNWSEGSAFEIYQEMEQIVYYLRRYNDEFLKSYNELDDLVSKIMGVCFGIFSKNSNFAKAYVIHEILEIIYGPKYPYQEDKNDVVTKIAVKENLHHSFGRLMGRNIALEDIIPHHITLVKLKAVAVSKLDNNWIDDIDLLRLRMTVVCELCKCIHEFKHIREDLINSLKDSPLTSEIKFFENLLKKKTVELETTKKTKDLQSTKDRSAKDLDVYGYSATSDMWSFIRNMNEVKIDKKVSKKKKI
jgi:bifunctional DNA-binding transcriptional regulator/antitoxin component of YhaV-PrlF toxin-antitoxin module